jgi:hypothetical protein
MINSSEPMAESQSGDDVVSVAPAFYVVSRKKLSPTRRRSATSRLGDDAGVNQRRKAGEVGALFDLQVVMASFLPYIYM